VMRFTDERRKTKDERSASKPSSFVFRLSSAVGRYLGIAWMA
jgi:hypothetical protein